MICYQDKTYCIAECSNNECATKLTDSVKSDAKKWWGGDDALIATSDFGTLCIDFKPLDEERVEE